MASERQILEELKKLRDRTLAVDVEFSAEEKQLLKDRKKRWLTYWRNNVNLYIEYKLGIKSYPFQHYSYYMMQEAQTYWEVSTRGVSKTFRMIVFGVAECLLRPNTKVVLTAATMGQALTALEEKLNKELFAKEEISYYIYHMFKKGLITKKETERGYLVEFFNGSSIYFVPCLDSSRGLRATILMYEECRLMKKSLIDSVFDNMLQPRQAGFMLKMSEKEKKKYLEEGKSLYITSNRFESEWFNTAFNKCFTGYFKDRYSENRIFCSDIFLALRHGLKTEKWFITRKETMNELDFRMEVLNETIGEGAGSYFKMEDFRKNQIIKQAFYPLSAKDIRMNVESTRPKREGEIRFLFVDFAFANTTSTKQSNDNTVIGCLNTYIKNDILYREVPYIEVINGGESDRTRLTIRELFFDFEADYIVLDLRNGGEVNYNDLTKPYIHNERPSYAWNRHGFTVANEPHMHMVKQAKLDDLRSRTVDGEAIPCIIPIMATPEFNSNMWLDLDLRLKNSELALLVDELEFTSMFETTEEWFNLTSEEKAEKKIPYIRTMSMMVEATNLTQSWSEGKMKLVEPNNGTKDSIVALAYGNYIATKMANHMFIEGERQEIDISAYTFMM